MRWLRAAAGFLCVMAVAATAQAGAVMHIDGGTAYLFSNEVHPISSPTITVDENGAGNPPLADPMLLIVGVPNTTAFAAPSVSLSSGEAALGGPGTGTNTVYGGSFTGGTGLATDNGGLFNAGSIYSFIGLTGGSQSDNFQNWAAADLSVNQITATGFGIFVYELTGTGINGGNVITATFNEALPPGSFVVAYGQADGKVFSTPFTETGLTTNGSGSAPPPAATPEPASLVLLGTGVATLWARRRRIR